MSNPAQDEFNALMARNVPRFTTHPEDFSSPEASDNETLSTFTPSDASTVKSRFSVLSKSRSSIRNAANRPHAALDAEDDHENEDDEEDYGGARRSKKSTYYIPDNIGYDSKTGPKGVIADARAFENERRAGNKVTYVRTEDMVLPKMQRADVRAGSQERRGRGGLKPEDMEGFDDEDDEDPGFMRSWREKRRRQMRDVKSQSPAGAKRGRYGYLRTVDAMGFLAAVESQFGTTVVVYVYDDDLPISKSYQEHLRTLAAKYADVNFIALHYEEAEMEHAGVPALLGYRHGEQFASMTPLKDEIPLTSNVVTSMENAFQRHVDHSNHWDRADQLPGIGYYEVNICVATTTGSFQKAKGAAQADQLLIYLVEHSRHVVVGLPGVRLGKDRVGCPKVESKRRTWCAMSLSRP